MGTVTVQITSAYKSYGESRRETPVLNGIDLTVGTDESLVLVGPSGCGKSTLLRVVAGLEPLDAGFVEWPAETGNRPRTGMVFQDALLMPWLTVRENVRFGGRYRANRAGFEESSVDALLARMELSDLAESYPDQLSGGQAQRVAIARAVAIRPRLLLLDEPFAALDPATRGRLREWLRSLTTELGLTTVLVTHDVDEALYLGDRIASLSTSGTVSRTWHNEPAGAAETNPLRGEVLAHYEADLGAVAAAHAERS